MEMKSQSEILNERRSIVLWRKPFTTIWFFTKNIVIEVTEGISQILQYKKIVRLFILLGIIVAATLKVNGPHQPYVSLINKYILRGAYWILLGILSSAGFGTGLHTFVLYLGPHIASVTIAAYECNTVDFPEPPYPVEIICPDIKGISMTIWKIMGKVRFDAMMWGFGTALGELPPFFMAKASRLTDIEDEPKQTTGFLNYLMNKTKYLILKHGFIGILLCASIPNPLFDFAGMACGHFLVPFWTFFTATTIGKAVIKMHLQQLVVIIAFNNDLLDKALLIINEIPILGPKLQEPIRNILQTQKEKLHGRHIEKSGFNFFKFCFDIIPLILIIYFVISIVNHMAQNYHKRLHENSDIKKYP